MAEREKLDIRKVSKYRENLTLVLSDGRIASISDPKPFNEPEYHIPFESDCRIVNQMVLKCFTNIYCGVLSGCYAGLWFWWLTRSMGVVHKNFISFVAMVTWRGDFAGGSGAPAPRGEKNIENCVIFSMKKYKFWWKNCKIVKNFQLQGPARISIQEDTLRARPRGGSGGGVPRTPENFQKISKNSLRKLQKCIILAQFSTKF